MLLPPYRRLVVSVFILVVTLCCDGTLSRHRRDSGPKAFGDPIEDMGEPNYHCPGTLMRRSRTVPTNANQVRPADINVIGALGDSLTAANGAGAPMNDALAILLQYRGLAFLAGGDKNLDEHITLPNIFKQYNSRVYGASNGIGTADVYEISHMNIGQPGARANDMPRQARELVHRLQTHSEVDFQNDWKFVSIFIGGNDMCGYCHDPAGHSAERFAADIQTAVQILYDNVPRTIVSLVSMFQMQMLRQIDSGQFFCSAIHLSECKCESDQGFTNENISAACVSYMQAQYAIQNSGVFDHKDDFAFVIQPYFQDITVPPKFPNGTVDLTFFAPDCFHFSQLGHAVAAKHTWNTMMQPVGSKQTNASLSPHRPLPPLACPDPNCPFIRTKANSANCAHYLTEPALE
jgi:phospholipase B1